MPMYICNRACPCPRCRMRGLLGPTLLITIGVLMLLSELYIVRFHYTWPIILIVVGVFHIFRDSMPMTGHRDPFVRQAPGAPAPPAAPAPGPGEQVNHV